MVRNRIKVFRAEAEISATALADKMPEGVDKIVMSYIEKGRVLPTREGLETMCDVFDCLPTDIYDAQDIDLLAVKREPEQQQPAPEPVKVKAVSNGKNPNEIIIRPARRSVEQHEGMEQIRVWMPAEEKAALFKAVAGLGYHSVAEWLREKYRETLRAYIALQLKDKTLHEAIPPTTVIKPSEVVE